MRIHATGSAGVRLLELVKTLVGGEKVEKRKEILSKDATVQCAAEETVAEETVVEVEDAVAEEGGEKGLEAVAMDVDVFESRPNFQSDPRQKSKRKFHMEKTLGMFFFINSYSFHSSLFLVFFLLFSHFLNNLI